MRLARCQSNSSRSYLLAAPATVHSPLQVLCLSTGTLPLAYCESISGHRSSIANLLPACCSSTAILPLLYFSCIAPVPRIYRSCASLVLLPCCSCAALVPWCTPRLLLLYSCCTAAVLPVCCNYSATVLLYCHSMDNIAACSGSEHRRPSSSQGSVRMAPTGKRALGRGCLAWSPAPSGAGPLM